MVSWPLARQLVPGHTSAGWMGTAVAEGDGLGGDTCEWAQATNEAITIPQYRRSPRLPAVVKGRQEAHERIVERILLHHGVRLKVDVRTPAI